MIYNILKQLHQLIGQKIHDDKSSMENDFYFKSIPKQANTEGYYITIFKNKNYGIELWLDYFTNIDRIQLCLTFYSRNKNIAEELLHLVEEHYIPGHITDVYEKRGYNYLKIPLSHKYFDSYIYEPYEDSFVSLYFSDVIDNKTISSKRFLDKLFLEIEYLYEYFSTFKEQEFQPEIDFQYEENRKLVFKHLIRERKTALANKVKELSKYICQICDFKYTEKYGILGANFAEAHHIVPLHTLNSVVKSREEDLICVCANCHRMLHRMEGKAGDIEELRQLVNKNNRKL